MIEESKLNKEEEPPLTDSAPVMTTKNIGIDASSDNSMTTQPDTDDVVSNQGPLEVLTARRSGSVLSQRRGKTYLCREQWRKTSPVYEQLFGESKGATKLFHALGNNLFIDRPYQSSFTKENEGGLLQVSLWYSNSLSQMQKSNGRYGVTLDFDQLHLLQENLEDIERALSLSGEERFLGFVLPLGKKWYVTVESGKCAVSFRRWLCFDSSVKDPHIELMPSRDGVRLTYEQFRKFQTFMSSQLNKVFPDFKDCV